MHITRLNRLAEVVQATAARHAPLALDAERLTSAIGEAISVTLLVYDLNSAVGIHPVTYAQIMARLGQLLMHLGLKEDETSTIMRAAFNDLRG